MEKEPVELKVMNGYSGSCVLLLQDSNGVFVRKFGQNERNLERIKALNKIGIRMPRVLSEHTNYYDMEYIRHTDVATWLLNNHVSGLIDWLCEVINTLSAVECAKDYTLIFEKRIAAMAHNGLLKDTGIDPEKLLMRLPKMLPASNYHGDLTMDNCLHGIDNQFYLIDPLTSDYDSWVFDLAKLMQDVDCGWFVRDNRVNIGSKLHAIRTALVTKYPIANNPDLLIMMLLRILPYTRNDFDKQWLIKEIKRLWT